MIFCYVSDGNCGNVYEYAVAVLAISISSSYGNARRK
jgi:hypothetical protein